jgi:hypothetical protein
MTDQAHKNRLTQMRKRKPTGTVTRAKTNGPSTTQVVPRQQPGTGTNTTPPLPDLNRRADMWTDTDSLSDRDDGSTIIRSPLPPQGGGLQQSQLTTTTTTTTTTSTRDADVGRLRTFVAQTQGQPRSTDMEAALRQMQEVVDAHDAGGVTDQTLQQAMATLRMIEVTGSATVPLTVATRQTPAFGLVLDGVRVTELDQTQRTAVERLRNGQKPDEAALGYILTDGTFNGTTADLAALLDEVEQKVLQQWTGQQLDDSKASQLARLAKDDEQEQKQLAAAFGAPLDGVSGPQCRELRNFFINRYPNFLRNVRPGYIKDFVFGSREGVKQGGGVFVSARKELHMGAMGAKAPEAFLRLMVHEAGHASFQRALIGGTPPTSVENGDYFGMLQRRALLLATANAQPDTARADLKRGRRVAIAVDPATAAAASDLADLNQRLPENDRMWNGMSDDAKELYRAWYKLRENKGEYMIGLDLGRKPNKKGTAMDPAQRQEYQAGGFSEFCAESFMHLAMGDLDRYEATIRTRNDVPPEVKQAWATTRRILHNYGDPILG